MKEFEEWLPLFLQSSDFCYEYDNSTLEVAYRAGWEARKKLDVDKLKEQPCHDLVG